MRLSSLIVILFTLVFSACQQSQEETGTPAFKDKFQERQTAKALDSLFGAKEYLSVYSHIYSLTEHKMHDLTATISIRNTSEEDSLFVERADYYNTKGKKLRSYLEKPIYLAPLETVEIIIQERDRSGGSGANFIFEWKSENEKAQPLFEGVMISTLGQQGLSFTTQSKRIN